MTASCFDIKEKKVLVTGGTRGLGRALSLHLASAGAQVIAGYFQNEEAAEELRLVSGREGYRCTAVKANLMNSIGIQSLVDFVKRTYSDLDALIYNSATGVHRPLHALTSRHLSTVWQVNVGAFFELSLKLKSIMKPGARIVAVSSEGAVRAVKEYGAVGSSKAALESICRQMAAEWAADGIWVNLVAPGLLETDTLKVWSDADERIKNEVRHSPIGRLVRLDEVAHLVHYLCSAASDGIQGQTLVIDGGKSITSG
ncbi:MAG: SDR family oxidoreductase [Acidobacteriota bacterium]